ncbi:nitrous oxide reductase family maturation protein NosD [Burkholderia ubonensis]|uniref:right-handed parallel beta-helix repeat-containing protein n=1 Tax=Burkholderia ubonensis TaxID=101571 RepID=UPI000B029DBD
MAIVARPAPCRTTAADASVAAAGHAVRQVGAKDAVFRSVPGSADQSDALQHALDALSAGQRLIVAPGSYLVGRSLVVKRPRAVISGYGATLIATDPDDQTIVMQGDGATLAGVTLIGVGTTRLETVSSTKVDVTGRGVQVLDVTIDGGASAGIFVDGGANVALVGNEVSATLADGIHVTNRARNVLVRDNVLRGTGDDMIAVVSYRKDGGLSGNVLIAGNSLEGNAWGRGVAVVGGENVTIAGNAVRGVRTGAGILVAQEDGYQTYDVTNVVVADNAVSNIQDPAYRSASRPQTEQAAIDLNAGSGSVSRVAVTGNRIDRSQYAGVRTLGNVCGIRVSGNQLVSVGGTPIACQSHGCGPGKAVIGHANTANGAVLAMPVDGATDKDGFNVSGANVRLLPQVRNFVRRSRPAASDPPGR